MEYRHEIINFNNKLPIKFFMHRIGDVNRHWHQSLELVVNIKGKLTIVVEEEKYHLSDGDMLLINSNEIHELHADDAIIIALQMKLELLKDINIDTKNLYFDCNSVTADNPDTFKQIKRVIAEILKYNMNHNELIDYKNASLIYELIYELCANFKIEKKETNKYSEEKLDRLSRVLDYIHSKYDENISLQSLAEKEFLSIPYLSKFFKRGMGISFSDYVKQIRLHYSVLDLLDDTLTIDEIAHKNGFPNTRSFVTAFKEKFEELPSVWRKQNIGKSLGSIEATKEKSVNYFQMEPHAYYEDVAQFIEEHLKDAPPPNHKISDVETSELADAPISVDLTKEEMQLQHTFKTFTGVSRAKEVLMAPVQEALTLAQKEIGYRYIKMHSLLDDDMMVYSEARDGTPIYNFHLIDQVIDFLLSIQLKPLIQFSFMPRLLASNLDKTVFYNQINTSPPKDIKKWSGLIRSLTAHLLNRYGKKEVRSWLFTVWNEPSSSNHLFGFRNNQTFYDLFQTTYQAVKEVDSQLPFGGPAAFSTYNKSEDWFFDFLAFSMENQCPPDFITIHYYDIDLSNVKKEELDISIFQVGNHIDSIDEQPLYLSPVEDSFEQFIDRLKKGLKEIGFEDKKVFLTEWNSTVSHRDLMNDTCFKSAYIIKNIIDNYDRLDAFGYWLLTDFHEEYLMSKNLFHGGLGMLAYQQIKKPSYHAFSFLNKLSDTLVEKGDGYLITKEEDRVQLLIHNYHHYNEKYAKGIILNISYEDRYSNFSNKTKKEFRFELLNLEGTFEIKHHIVNREHGSAYDNELKLGKIGEHSTEELDYLRNISVPKMEIQQVFADGKLYVEAELEPFEIRLIELIRIV
ncbi:xylan 1,4-beta-xylosidase [Evansella caseinilytica]|uniref:Xylan 1,4-beta-xylosidase n=1 Tax=Evansella caseinilytica TaxID=1503961 RepID=A0A1H3UKH1_9BACI|nr:helix-turn-helix domain-containing protein [Evansella caseinilytica]SDZ62816.1 xylan 1,4-beta-xylosidase [Evansella caseinilytica]